MRALSILFALLIPTFPAAAAESAKGDHVRVSWLAPESFGPGRESVAILYSIEPEWHVYWKNPGDSGAAPKFTFKIDGAAAGPILWPRPERLPIAHLTNIGYDREVAFPFELRIAPGAKRVGIDVKLEWLVCKEECLPGFATISLDRPVKAGPAVWSERQRDTRDEYLARTPRPSADSPWKAVEARGSARGLALKLRASPPTDDVPEVFPIDPEHWGAGAPGVENSGDSLVFSVPGNDSGRVPASTSVLVADSNASWELTDIPVIASADDGASFWILLLSAFFGGILLNLMPCVLPVLSIKLFSLAKSEPAARVRESLAYTAGVIVTFTAIGAGFLALRAGGSAVGWGFQLQSPTVILALAVLFWLMGLNFFGFFELGTAVMNAAGRFGRTGSFMTGVLSVFVAAPCTGPFMGTALGAAATLPALPSLGIFVALGGGLAAPFVAVCFVPGLFAKLPKPGAWMETLRQFLAFPLFGTVLWLLWILEMQTGSDGLFAAGSLLLTLTFAIWLGRGAKRARAAVAWLIALAAIATAAASLKETAGSAGIGSAAGAGAESWAAYDRARLNEARAANQPVFVDFTAAWCITCQVNKKTTLNTTAIAELFARHDVLALRADWTKQDPAITAALAELGRSSVPVYAFYPAGGGAVRLLPQILTVSTMEQLFSQ